MLKNLGHLVARSTVATILRAEGIPPSRHLPTTWRTFLRAHWPADFFTTEVWTVRELAGPRRAGRFDSCAAPPYRLAYGSEAV